MNRYYSGEQSSLNSFAIDNQLEADFATASLQHKVVLGFDFQHYVNNLKDQSGYASDLNPYTGLSGLYGEDDIDLYSNTKGKRRYQQTGVYLQDDMVWNKWHATLSGRYDVLKTKNTQYESIYDVETDSKRSDNHFSGRASCSMPTTTGFHLTSATARQ